MLTFMQRKKKKKRKEQSWQCKYLPEGVSVGNSAVGLGSVLWVPLGESLSTPHCRESSCNWLSSASRRSFAASFFNQRNPQKKTKIKDTYDGLIEGRTSRTLYFEERLESITAASLSPMLARRRESMNRPTCASFKPNQLIGGIYKVELFSSWV